MAAAAPPVPVVRYRWAAPGDLNAFFGLMLDNVMNLVILAGILIGVFSFPADVVYTYPGDGSTGWWSASTRSHWIIAVAGRCGSSRIVSKSRTNSMSP